MNSTFRPSFGWLLLGLAWGLLAGHALAVHFLIRPGYFDNHLQRWAYVLFAGACIGLGVGVIIDANTKRGTTWLDWAAFVAIASIYLFLSLPSVNAARE